MDTLESLVIRAILDNLDIVDIQELVEYQDTQE